jgi:hypothetical protein
VPVEIANKIGLQKKKQKSLSSGSINKPVSMATITLKLRDDVFCVVLAEI